MTVPPQTEQQQVADFDNEGWRKRLYALNAWAETYDQRQQDLHAKGLWSTDAVSEALHLAFANGFVVGALGGNDGARRTYGCLYGLEKTGDRAIYPVVPAFVSKVSRLQKVASLLFIFLFGLGIRNMLRLK